MKFKLSNKLVFEQLMDYIVEAFDKDFRCDSEQDVIDIQNKPLRTNVMHGNKDVILFLTKQLE